MREFKVAWSPPALQDYFDLVDYVAADAPLTALSVSDRIERSAQSLRRFPQRGRRLPELVDDPDVALMFEGIELRELIVKPWRLIYWIDGDRVTLAALIDSRMDGTAWMERQLPTLLKLVNK